MSTIVELVNSTPAHGGLSDGYRRSQLGQPTGTVGQPPRFRGETNTPGNDVKAPRILSSAARNNRATNVTIPYARVVPADELCNKGRLSPGDVAFVSRYQYGRTNQLKKNQHQKSQVVTSVSIAHAGVSRIAGLDYINRALGPDNYKGGSTVLVDSYNPLDEWRSLTFLNEWTLDGVVMSNDSPGYVLGASGDARNDQLFNMGIQGPVQINNGYQDDAGRGLVAHYDRRDMSSNSLISNLIAGPFYKQYPMQMFDRKIRPLSELYIGLICRKIEEADLKTVNAANQNKLVNAANEPATHIHVFQYVCFSSQQVYQYATTDNDNAGDDLDIVNTYGSEPADRRRGPNDPKRGRTPDYLPRKRLDSNHDVSDDSFQGIKKEELENMVGAWRIGKVLDVASKRMEGYMGGPIDTAFSVTLNFDMSFLDWRQLRRNFTSNIFGRELDLLVDGFGNKMNFRKYDASTQRFENDNGRVMQWPTWYDLSPELAEGNIPINPTTKDEKDGRGNKKHILEAQGTPDEQRQDYKHTVNNAGTWQQWPSEPGQPYAYPPNEPIGQSAFGASAVGQAHVEPASTAPPVSAASTSTVAALVAPAQAPASTAISSKSTGKSKAVQPPPAAPPAAPKPTAKSTAKSTAKPIANPASRTTTKPIGTIGDEEMAEIFKSQLPVNTETDASTSGASGPERTESEDKFAQQPRSFPRRRER